jgi:hypothetical protein
VGGAMDSVEARAPARGHKVAVGAGTGLSRRHRMGGTRGEGGGRGRGRRRRRRRGRGRMRMEGTARGRVGGVAGAAVRKSRPP